MRVLTALCRYRQLRSRWLRLTSVAVVLALAGWLMGGRCALSPLSAAPWNVGAAEIGVLLTLAQQPPDPDPVPDAEPLPGDVAEPAVPEESPDDDLTMNLPERPLRVTRAQPGNWFDISEDGEISEVLRRHWVRLDEDGQLRGKISTLENGRLLPSSQLHVNFLQRGRIITSTWTDSEGRFTADGLPRGVYCLIARGANGFLAYSVNIVQASDRQARVVTRDGVIRLVQLGGVRSELEIDSVAVPPTFNTVRNLIRRYNSLDSGESTLEPAAAAQGEGAATPPAVAPQAPPRLPAAESGLSQQEQLDAPPASSIANHVVYLNPEGKLIGKLTSIDFDTGRPKAVEEVTVHIIRNDRLVGRGAVRRTGVFEVQGLQAGSYSLVATGRGGFGAIGFELRSRDRQARHRASDHDIQWAIDRQDASIVLVRQLDKLPDGDDVNPISISLVDDPRNLRAALRPQAGQPALMGGAPPPFAGAGGGGGATGSGASGGFAGGGGGLGAALLGAGGLAAGITALAQDGGGSEDQMRSVFMVDPPVVNSSAAGADYPLEE